MWITETADSACGGNPWASTFLDSFRFLDQLARMARQGVSAVFHNTLASSEYGLLDQNTFTPRPNYWAALLWRKLMGSTVWRYRGADFKLEGKSGTLGGKQPYSVAVHPNGDRIAVGFDVSSAVEVYRAEDLDRLFAADTADVANGSLNAVAWSADGARLYAGGSYRADGADWVRI